jgi:antitoxin PrlF
MAKKNSYQTCPSDDAQYNCHQGIGCGLEAVLAIDDRGQMVLPKDVHERADIKPGDKLALFSWEKNGSICCLALMKAENMNRMVKDVLGPMMSDTQI